MIRQSPRGRRFDPVIAALVAALVVVGLLLLLSATSPVAFNRTGDALYYFKRQLLFGVLPGIPLFLFFSFVDYHVWKKLAPAALVVTIILLVIVYIPGIGVSIGGARGWAKLGPVTFQTSELVKLAFLIYLAAWLSERPAADLRTWEHGLKPFGLVLGAVVFLLVMQPDTGSTAVIAGTSVVLFLLAGAPIAWIGGMIGVGAAGLVLLLLRSPYRAARYAAFLHPEADPLGIGYHINQALLAIGSGGILGLGYGHSRQKFLYLPEVEADSIFAVVAEELGFVLVLGLLALFGALLWRCFMIARGCKDRFGALLAAGVGTWLGLQILLNIGSMTSLLPITGVTLPFISHGGSSLAILLGAMGLVAGIPKRGEHV